MAVLQTATVSDAAVSFGSLVIPGPVVARAVLSSAMVGAGTSQTVSQSGLTSTVAGSIPRRTSQAKASTAPSSGLARAKDGVTYCTPQRTRMWGSGDVRQMRSSGHSVRGKVAICLSCDLGVVPCFSSGRVNNAGKALRPGSSLPEASSAARVSDAACCVCRPKSSGGGRVGGVAPGGYVRFGACLCPWSRRGPPVCGLPGAIWREETVDARAWMLARIARCGGLCQHANVVGTFLLLVVLLRVSVLVRAAVVVGLGALSPAHGCWESGGGGHGDGLARGFVLGGREWVLLRLS